MQYERLRQDLYADIDYPAALTTLIGAAEPWRAFCALPQETKAQFHFDDYQHDADPGYRLRTKAAGREDKEYFHIYPNIFELIKADGLAGLVEGDPALKSFFTYGKAVYEAAYDFAAAIGRDIGAEVPELARIIEAGQLRATLRLLHYMNDAETESIAAQHFDRSLYTLHLYESGPGLEFLDWNMQWHEAPIAHGTTVVFSGYRLEKLTGGKVQKTWHRVTRREGVQDRISMVLFLWTHEVEDYDRDGRAQELTPAYIRVS